MYLAGCTLTISIVRYKAIVEYDGTDYAGYQRQPEGRPTVQGEIEAAIRRITPLAASTIAAGRTDTGVHAIGQVVAFNVDWAYGTEALQKAINSKLPRDIVFLTLEAADDDFHPRFQAEKRSYQYTICNHAQRRPLLKRTTWQVRERLDVEQMNVAAATILGVHDFRTFGTPPQGNNSVREVFVAQWQRDGDILTFDITATAFLRRMVRSLVGSLKFVGDGLWTVDDFEAALAACNRVRTGATAPPQGLVLTSVEY